MKPRRKSILAMLDDTVRWTGMPARVSRQMSGESFHKQRPLRWIPIWPIVFSCVLLTVSLAWPQALAGFGLIGVVVPFWCLLFAMTPSIQMNGPLGKPSLEDDEREAALRKDSLVLCLGLLAALNVLGQPLLMVLSRWQDWPLAQTVSVVTSAFMLNAALWACLPTLYASWNLPQLPEE